MPFLYFLETLFFAWKKLDFCQNLGQINQIFTIFYMIVGKSQGPWKSDIFAQGRKYSGKFLFAPILFMSPIAMHPSPKTLVHENEKKTERKKNEKKQLT